MDINHGWLDNLLFHPVDHQQQTFVTKHDLALLHKKIIATDLIVQKYQEANKALVGLQVENEQLRQQVEQITHECCIFGKQVTECTQESDHLKEEIDKLNAEKRQLNTELRELRDENTTYHHEVMVLRQYESLAEKNDQATKIIERQQKEIARLQLRAQRSSPVVYKPIRSNQEATETETALVESKKSIRELKLALGRVMNFLTNSKIEIPSSLHIRPVLKAHDINDDFLEREGEYVLQRVRRKSKRTVQPAVVPDEKHNNDDDDDDDDNEGFIDVFPTAATTIVPVTSASTLVENSKEIPSLPTPVEQKKKRRKTKKRDVEDLAHELEMAIADVPKETHKKTTSHLVDLFGDDPVESEAEAEAPAPVPDRVTPTPSIFKRPSIPQTNSSITFTRRRESRTEGHPTKEVSFLSDEEDMDTATPVESAVLIPFSLPPSQLNPTPRSNEFRTSISFLSEDDDIETAHFQPQSPEFPPPTVKPAYESRWDEITAEMPPTPPATLTTVEESQPNDEILRVRESIEEIPAVVQKIIPSTQVIDEPIKTPISSTEIIENSAELAATINQISEQPVESPAPSSQIIEQTVESVVPPIPIIEESIAPTITIIEKPVEPTVPSTQIVGKPVQSVEKPAETVILSTRVIAKPITSTTKAIELPVTRTIGVIEKPMTAITKPVEKPMAPPKKDPIRMNLVFRLLKVMTEVPVPLKPLRLCHRRIRLEKVAKKVENSQPSPVPMIPVIEEHPVPMEINSSIEQSVEIIPSIPASVPVVEEQLKFVEIMNEIPMSEILKEKATETLIEPTQESSSPLNIKTSLNPPPLSATTVSLVSRLLHVLTTLPVPNAHYSHLYRSKKRNIGPTSQAASVVSRPAPAPTPAPAPISTPVATATTTKTQSRLSQSPSRMTTRSITSIRACIARCNRPDVSTRKRSAQDLPSTVAAPPMKRLRSSQSEMNDDEFDRLKKFLQTFAKEINAELKIWIENKLKENLTLFTDEFYNIVMEIFYCRANVILPFVKNLHPHEDSLKILMKFLENQSKEFPSNILSKLKRSFEIELEQKTIVSQRLKILNRLYFLICSISVSTPTLIYTHLFDIGYSLTKDFLTDALLFVEQNCSSIKTKTSNGFLHRILFEIFTSKNVEISIEYLENLFVSYLRENGDQEDFIRSLILLCRHQNWSWCSQEFFLKLVFPLFNRIKDNSLIFILLQNIIFVFKNNEDFRRDRTFHLQIEQLFSSKTNLSTDLCHRRDQILFIVQNCS